MELSDKERECLSAIRNLVSEVARTSTVGHLYDFLQEIELTEVINDGSPSEWVFLDGEREISIPGQVSYSIYVDSDRNLITFKVGDSVWVFKFSGGL